MKPRTSGTRNTRFDRLRILFATLVLCSHAPELTDGNPSRELFHRITHVHNTLGGVGVTGFFLLSGFLIVRSWESDPDLLNFLFKRLLRIVPGYLVAVTLSILVVGWLAPATPHFFREFSPKYLKGVLLLSSPATPPVLPGMPYAMVNGSLWTIGYEFRCYLLVALFGICGCFRRPYLWLIATGLFSLLALHPAVHSGPVWHAVYVVIGDPVMAFSLAAIFFVGGSFYLFRRQIPFGWTYASAAGVLLILGIFSNRAALTALTLMGGYLLFYFAQRPERVSRPHPFPDISYGIYLYGWPIESLWIFFFHGSPWVTFAVSTLIAALCGYLSWHFVERPMLRLKRHTAPLPP